MKVVGFIVVVVAVSEAMLLSVEIVVASVVKPRILRYSEVKS